MRLLLIIFFMTLLFSCREMMNEKINFSNKEPIPVDSLSDDAFFSIVYLDSPNYKIRWGHKNIDTLLTDSTYILLGSGSAGYLTSNKSVIFLEQECGTECNYVVSLPFDRKVKPKLFYECVAIDTTNNLIAYVTESETSFLVLENILSGDKIKISEENICNSPIKVNCIDSCYFDNDFFYLKWFGKQDEKIRKYPTKAINK